MALKPKRKVFKININDTQWKYRLLSDETYRSHHDESGDGDSAAITDRVNKTIDFKVDELDFGLVVHEVYHVLMDGLNLASAADKLDLDSIEEIVAGLLQSKWTTLLDKSLTIYSNIDNIKYNESGFIKIHQAILDLT